MTLWYLALFRRRRSVHRALAANPSAPPLLLWYLACFSRWDVKAIVVLNPRCGRHVHSWMVHENDWAVRAALASNPLTTPNVLRTLASAFDPRVLMAVAANPALPADLVDTLLKYRSVYGVYVRGVAAANPNADGESLRELARGMTEPAWVLRAIAANPSCPDELSDQLLTWIALGGAGDADPMFDPVACTGHPDDTRVDVVSRYAALARTDGAERHPLWRVRAVIGQARRTLPQPLIAELRRDPRPEVRRSVASFTPVPPRAIRELIGDADPAVSRIAARVRKENRVGYNVVRARRILPRLAPLAPLVFMAAVLFPYPHHSQQSPHSPHSPSSTAGAGRPGSGDCGSLVTAPRARAGGAGTLHLTVRPAATLPGGATLVCGTVRTADGSRVEALMVLGGSAGARFVVPADIVRLASGRRIKNVPLPVPPGHYVLVTLPGDPTHVLVAISSGNTRTKVIRVHLFFGPNS